MIDIGYSNLVQGVVPSPNCTKYRNHTIDSVIIHTMAGNISVETCGSWFNNPSCQASANYGIDSSGKIFGYVDENDRAWASSNSGVDNRAISIEVASTTSAEPFAISEEAYQSLVSLLIDICQRYQFTLKWMNNEAYAISAANGGNVDQQNMFLHKWFANKSCPGKYLIDLHPQIVKDVNSKLSINTLNHYNDNIIFVGDSIVLKLQRFDVDKKYTWISSNSAEKNWFKSIADSINNKISEGIHICIFINSIYTISLDYVELINEYSKQWTESGAKVYCISCNPYYGADNSNIAQVNQKIRNNLNFYVTYIDTYSSILNTLLPQDTVEYSSDTLSAIYNMIVSSVTSVSSSLYYNSAIIGGTPVQIDYTKINPYIISIDRNTSDSFSYETIYENQIVGVILEIGYLYDTTHKQLKDIKQPKFQKQQNSLKQNNIPFGYYFISRASSIEEATSEIYQLSFVLRSYSHELGVWIKPEFKDNVSVNDKILSLYQAKLYNLGFKSKIGIYIDKEKLSTITWEKFQEDWLLWIVDPVESISELQKLLDPSFFKVGG